MSSDSEMPPFEQWCVLELFGHVRMAGRVTEEDRFGGKLGRIDTPGPAGDGFVTTYFGYASIYRMTPTTEAVARAVARQNQPRPVHQWELPKPEVAPEVLKGVAPRGGYLGPDEDDDDGIDFGDDDA